MDERVGYATISILRDTLKEYVLAFTVNGKYEGELQYIIKLKQLEDYLGD